jgi:hypothetical protein
MESLKARWKNTHPTIRKPIVFIVGSLFVLAAIATGWLPGPGGIPLFLIGIAILATEFIWAERFRDKIIAWLAIAGQWLKAHRIFGSCLIAVGVGMAASVVYLLYFQR